MREKMTTNESDETIESTVELIPSNEDVEAIFEVLLEGREGEVILSLSDEKGVYLHEVRNDEGDVYSYMRKGAYAEGAAINSAVHVIFHDEEGRPIDGHRVATFMPDGWVMVG